MDNLTDKDNYIVINFKTHEVVENKLKPISDELLLDVAKKACHYINYSRRKEIEDFMKIVIGDFEIKDSYIKCELIDIYNHKNLYSLNENKLIFSSDAPKQKIENYNKLQKTLKLEDEKERDNELKLLSQKIKLEFDKNK